MSRILSMLRLCFVPDKGPPGNQFAEALRARTNRIEPVKEGKQRHAQR